jgi:hypothetical protein
MNSLRVKVIYVLAVGLVMLAPFAARAQQAQTITIYPPSAKSITPSNTALLTDHAGNPVNQYVYVNGAGGDVVCEPTGNPDGTAVTFTLVVGQFVPVSCKRVYLTGTTATGLVGIF